MYLLVVYKPYSEYTHRGSLEEIYYGFFDTQTKLNKKQIIEAIADFSYKNFILKNSESRYEIVVFDLGQEGQEGKEIINFWSPKCKEGTELLNEADKLCGEIKITKAEEKRLAEEEKSLLIQKRQEASLLAAKENRYRKFLELKKEFENV